MTLHDETVESIHQLLVGDDGDDFIYSELPEAVGGYPLTIRSEWNYGDGHERGVIFTLAEARSLWYTRHFRMTGSYSSWGSSDWDGPLEEVVAVEQMTTFYARKDGYK